MRFGRRTRFGLDDGGVLDRRYGDTGEDYRKRAQQQLYAELNPGRYFTDHLDGTFLNEWACDCEARSKIALLPARVLLVNFVYRMWLDAELDAHWKPALEWFRNDEAAFSFGFACEQLGLDADRLGRAFTARFEGPKRVTNDKGNNKRRKYGDCGV